VTFRRIIFTLLAAACFAAPNVRAVDHALASYEFVSVRSSIDADLNSSASDLRMAAASRPDHQPTI